PHPQLAKTGVKAIVDHFERQIRALPEEPILIGHSAGAVWVQQLLDRGLGVAGVSIDPAPTTGVPLGPHAIVSAAPALFAWNGWNRSLQMTRKFFATRFAQTIPTRAEADELYDRYIVPTAGKVYWDGVVSSTGKIRWDNPNRAPLLLIGGGKDLIADASMTRAIYKKQRKARTRTDLHIFEDRSHWTLMDKGWEQVADMALNWAVAQAGEGKPQLRAVA
ncbi:MAG: alpha/beta fold hydrolase, partial [Devosia sp.]|uniref:alpha/beta hydrolase n=1 Tax=Devosia sp. TaxID=1871048 RepID=UPI003392B4A3